MTHPKLSVNALSSVRWSFDQDLELWQELGLHWAGLLRGKLGDEVDGRIARLADAGIRVSTVVARRFDLGAPETWEATREDLHLVIDAIAAHDGWSVYLTPGRTTGAPWDELLDILTEAITPSVAYARERGVRLGFEPSRRTEVSFVNSLRDAIDVAAHTGLGIVSDIGNFWMERDLTELLLKAAPHTVLVQLTDVEVGTVRSPDDPPGGGRTPFGEGDLPIPRILGDIRAMEYGGPFDLEVIGPLGDREGYEPTIRRAVAAAEKSLAECGL